MLCEAITFDHIYRELPEMLILIFLLLLYVLIFPHPLYHSEGQFLCWVNISVDLMGF